MRDENNVWCSVSALLVWGTFPRGQGHRNASHSRAMTEGEDVTTLKDGEHTEINLQPLDDDCRLLGSVRCLAGHRTH